MKINEVVSKKPDDTLQEGIFDVFRSSDDIASRDSAKDVEAVINKMYPIAAKKWIDQYNAMKASRAATNQKPAKGTTITSGKYGQVTFDGNQWVNAQGDALPANVQELLMSRNIIDDREFETRFRDWLNANVLKDVGIVDQSSKDALDQVVQNMVANKDDTRAQYRDFKRLMTVVVGAQRERRQQATTQDLPVGIKVQGSDGIYYTWDGRDWTDKKTGKNAPDALQNQLLKKALSDFSGSKQQQAEPQQQTQPQQQPDDGRAQQGDKVEKGQPITVGSTVTFKSSTGRDVTAKVVGPSKDGDENKVAVNSGKQDYNIPRDRLTVTKDAATTTPPVEKTAQPEQPAKQVDANKDGKDDRTGEPIKQVDANKDGKDDTTGEPVKAEPGDKEQPQDQTTVDLFKVIGPAMRNQIDSLNAADKEALLKALTGKKKVRAAK
jgi:hypothetical protein